MQRHVDQKIKLSVIKYILRKVSSYVPEETGARRKALTVKPTNAQYI